MDKERLDYLLNELRDVFINDDPDPDPDPESSPRVTRVTRRNPHSSSHIQRRALEVVERSVEALERICLKLDTESAASPVMARTPGETRKGSGDISEFEHDLAALINRYSLENETNVPDFILANYLVRCLESFRHTVQWTHNWYDHTTWPSPKRPTDDIDASMHKLREKEGLTLDQCVGRKD